MPLMAKCFVNANVLQLRIRMPSGSNLMRRFAPGQTLREVFATVHASGCRLDPSKQYALTSFGTPALSEADKTLQELGVTRGAYNLSEA